MQGRELRSERQRTWYRGARPNDSYDSYDSYDLSMLVALLAAINAINAGGRNLNMGSALIYAIIATTGCFIIALYMRRSAKITGSSLVAMDAKGWMIDGVFSAAVCLTFLAVYLL